MGSGTSPAGGKVKLKRADRKLPCHLIPRARQGRVTDSCKGEDPHRTFGNHAELCSIHVLNRDHRVVRNSKAGD